MKYIAQSVAMATNLTGIAEWPIIEEAQFCATPGILGIAMGIRNTLESIYRRFPRMRQSCNIRFAACVFLCPVIFVVLSLVSYFFAMAGWSWLNTHQLTMIVISVLPGAIIMRDNKAGISMLAYLFSGWFLSFVSGMLLLIGVWAIAGD
ncbi:MAG: hypothetical protein JWO78_1945 [Micavibrio sp.]|nr:hypothetical protein [Micavibrio sp.]